MRYVAFLRGVSPSNLKMADLKLALEKAGYENVVTLLSSGNAIFDAPSATEAQVEKAIGGKFAVFLRKQGELRKLLETEPYGDAPGKRVVTFLRKKVRVELPLVDEDVQVVAVHGLEAFTTYQPGDGAYFMQVLGRVFGKDCTTRTWETVAKAAAK